VHDEAGGKPDAVEIRLDDRDGAIELPFPGAPLVVFMGYKERILFPMGAFTADEVSMKGPPASLTIRGKYKSVNAIWHDNATGKKEEVTAGEDSPVFSIRHTHTTKEEAENAAKAKLDEMARGTATLSLTMAGDPGIAAEGQALLLGFRIGVDGVWSIKSVKHTLSNSGFKAEIEGEKPKD